MAKTLNDVLRGTNKAKTEKLSLGTDPDIDYDPKAPDDRKFVAKHTVTKRDWTGHNDDAVFDGSNIKRKSNYEATRGYDKGEDKRAYGIQREERLDEISPFNARRKARNATDREHQLRRHQGAEFANVTRYTNSPDYKRLEKGAEQFNADKPEEEHITPRDFRKEVKRVKDGVFRKAVGKAEDSIERQTPAKELDKTEQAYVDAQAKKTPQTMDHTDFNQAVRRGWKPDREDITDALRRKEKLTPQVSLGTKTREFLPGRTTPQYVAGSVESRVGTVRGERKAGSVDIDAARQAHADRINSGAKISPIERKKLDVKAGILPRKSVTESIDYSKLEASHLDRTKAELLALANKVMHIILCGSDHLHGDYNFSSKVTDARRAINDIHDHMCFSGNERKHKEMEEEESNNPPVPSAQPSLTYPSFSDKNNLGGVL